ncbi:MAG: succinate dehydrogenase, hydrophobic membrane anchor protein [Rhizobiales bacterium 65-9]|nr:succinate dehydrogenase, hydrophobic membrane anchor protein [Hyphomicrobiales bacterium]OJY36461.1 MAG: succinate dehydrogenase, hydrophobic membrane anchor protein [Rhizobiales bacterium 65-9]
MAAIDFRIQTPLRRVRGLGSAKAGTEHFWLQRVTAFANLFLAIAFILVVISLAGRDYEAARALLSRPLVGVLMGLFVISGCVHMRIGMQVVIEDYLHGGVKVAAVIANTFFAILVGAACLFALARLAFGN